MNSQAWHKVLGATLRSIQTNTRAKSHPIEYIFTSDGLVKGSKIRGD